MTRIVYLHGFASSPASTKARFFHDSLTRAGAEVDIPDLAAGDFEHLTITGQLAVLDQSARGEPVALMGSSMGGYLAALYAARHPEVARLVLLAPAFDFSARWRERLGDTEFERWRRSGCIQVFHYGDRTNRPLSFDLLPDSARYEAFPDFRQPALIFHGIHDDVVPAAYSQQFAAAHPNATLELLDSGHDLLNMLNYMEPKVRQFLLRG